MERDVPTKTQLLQYYRENLLNRNTLAALATVLLYTVVILAPGFLLSYLKSLL